MSPRAKVRMAWALLAGGIIGWPTSAIWLARDEPPFVRDQQDHGNGQGR